MPKLSMFIVQGWMKTYTKNDAGEVIEGVRKAMTSTNVNEVDGYAAARLYARSHGLKREQWDDGSPNPFIVIRVTDSDGTITKAMPKIGGDYLR